MTRTVFGRPLRGVAFDVAISACVAVFSLAAVMAQPGSWKMTLIGLAMAVALLFRRTRPSASGAVVAALAAVQTAVGWEPAGGGGARHGVALRALTISTAGTDFHFAAPSANLTTSASTERWIRPRCSVHTSSRSGGCHQRNHLAPALKQRVSSDVSSLVGCCPHVSSCVAPAVTWHKKDDADDYLPGP